MPNYSINLTTGLATGCPSLLGEFKRVNVFLGSNGTGKSKLLRELAGRAHEFGGRVPAFVQGGRVITIPGQIKYAMNTLEAFATAEKARKRVNDGRLAEIHARHADAFYLLERLGNELKVRHSDAVTAWQATDRISACPLVGESPLQELFKLFANVFPEITITISGDDNDILCRKNGSEPYSASKLSSGESQVLFLLADIALAAERNSVVLIDEPELNLNPLLAERLWDTVESYLPDSIFLYATHSIGFAMRPSVERIFSLQGGARPIVQLQNLQDLSRDSLREFLGVIPTIFAYPVSLAVEGTETSFDADFYSWLLGRHDVGIVPLGPKTQVLAAARAPNKWSTLGADANIVGVVDRDYSNLDPGGGTQAASCIVLDFHEAESYLCQPIVVCAVAEALGIAASMPSPTDVESAVLEYLQDHLKRIVVSRVSARAQATICVSLPRNVWFATDLAYIDTLFRERANESLADAAARVGADAVSALVDVEKTACQSALDARDVEAALTLVPGKELLPRVARLAGCDDEDRFARAAYKHFNISASPKLIELRKRLNAALAT